MGSGRSVVVGKCLPVDWPKNVVEKETNEMVCVLDKCKFYSKLHTSKAYNDGIDTGSVLGSLNLMSD